MTHVSSFQPFAQLQPSFVPDAIDFFFAFDTVSLQDLNSKFPVLETDLSA